MWSKSAFSETKYQVPWNPWNETKRTNSKYANGTTKTWISDKFKKWIRYQQNNFLNKQNPRVLCTIDRIYPCSKTLQSVHKCSSTSSYNEWTFINPFSFGQSSSNPSTNSTSNNFGSFNFNQPSTQTAQPPAQSSPFGFGSLGTTTTTAPAPTSTSSGMFGSIG